jgi:hypothetical protein
LATTSECDPGADTEAGADTQSDVNATDLTIRTPTDQGPRLEKPDLWQLACDSLESSDTKDRLLSHAQITLSTLWSPKSFVDDAVALTRKRCEEYQQSGWHITKKDGKDVKVTEKAKSTFCSLLEYKALIDAGLKYDATGYGATAWSVVSFGLQVS